MPHEPTSRRNPNLRSLVQQCVLALDIGDEAAVAAICNAHPEHAEAIQRKLSALGACGLVGTHTPNPAATPIRIPVVPNYETIERIGSGGMGEVWLAEQHRPIRRQLALKVLRRGLDTDELLRRFDRERRVLALMDHPGIAKIFDAGATDDGRPFFAMQLVRGAPITSACRDHGLQLDARLRLFVDVCDAVQHAHHKGVIHRDLKPSNVLVVGREGRLEPRIIDFGVAKAVFGEGEDRTELTTHDRLLGTPEYMSPEQAAGDMSRVDARTDVYALGVILFELLTGELPFPSTHLRSAGQAEMRRVLRDERTPAPSSRLPIRAGTDKTRLARALRRELDWITLRALEKDPDRRFATPTELAADIERYLARLPIESRPPSSWYRLRTLALRHRVAVAAGALTIFATIVGLGVSLERLAAERDARREADQSFEIALAAIDEMLGRVSDAFVDSPELQGIHEELDSAQAALLARLMNVRAADTRLRLRAARAHREVAIAQIELGQLESAAEVLARARTILESAPSEHRGTPLGRIEQREQLEQSIATAVLVHARGDRTTARDRLRELVRSIPLHDEQTDVSKLRAYYALAMAEGDDARPALAAFDAARAACERLCEGDTKSRWLDKQLTRYLQAHANALLRNGRVSAARERIATALTFLESLCEQDPTSRSIRGDLALTHRTMAEVCTMQRRTNDSIHHAETAIEIASRLTADFPRSTSYRDTLSGAHNSLARALVSRADVAAVDHHEQTVALQRAQIERQPNRLEARFKLVQCLTALASTIAHLHFEYRRPTDLDRAEQSIREAIDLARDLFTSAPDDPRVPRLLASASYVLADLSRRSGKLVSSIEHFEDAIAQYDAATAAGGESFDLRLSAIAARQQLGGALLALDQAPQAIVTLEVAHTRAAQLVEDRPELRGVRRALLDTRRTLANAYLQHQRPSEAAEIARVLLDDTPSASNPPRWAAPILFACYRAEHELRPGRATCNELAREVMDCVRAGIDASEQARPGHAMNGLIRARLRRIRLGVLRTEGHTEEAAAEADAAIAELAEFGEVPRSRPVRSELHDLIETAIEIAASRDDAKARRLKTWIETLDASGR